MYEEKNMIFFYILCFRETFFITTRDVWNPYDVRLIVILRNIAFQIRESIRSRKQNVCVLGLCLCVMGLRDQRPSRELGSLCYETKIHTIEMTLYDSPVIITMLLVSTLAVRSSNFASIERLSHIIGWTILMRTFCTLQLSFNQIFWKILLHLARYFKQAAVLPKRYDERRYRSWSAHELSLNQAPLNLIKIL